MSVRVNLLRPEEIRQQTGVGRESMLRAVGIAASSLAVAGLVWGVFQYRSVRSGHALAKERWASLETRYEQVKKVHAANASNLKYLDELGGWTASRIDWSEPLRQLQEFVPDNIQLTRLTVQGEILISEEDPKTKESPGTPARRYSVRMEGRALGSLSDQDVIRFVDELRGASTFQDWLASVKLQSLERTRARGIVDEEAEEERKFRVDAASMERMIKS